MNHGCFHVSLNPSKAVVASQVTTFSAFIFLGGIVFSIWVLLVTVSSFVFLGYCSLNPFSENNLDSFKSAGASQRQDLPKSYHIIVSALDILFVLVMWTPFLNEHFRTGRRVYGHPFTALLEPVNCGSVVKQDSWFYWALEHGDEQKEKVGGREGTGSDHIMILPWIFFSLGCLEPEVMSFIRNSPWHPTHPTPPAMGRF